MKEGQTSPNPSHFYCSTFYCDLTLQAENPPAGRHTTRSFEPPFLHPGSRASGQLCPRDEIAGWRQGRRTPARLSAPPAPEDPPPRRTPRPHQARARHVGHPRARDDSQNRGGWGRSCSPASGTGSRKGPSPDGRLAGTGQRGCPLRSWRGGAPGARGKEGFCASPGGQGTLERRRCCSPAPESRVLGVGTLSVPPRPKHSGASPESLFLIKIQSCSISQVGAIDGLKGPSTMAAALPSEHRSHPWSASPSRLRRCPAGGVC